MMATEHHDKILRQVFDDRHQVKKICVITIFDDTGVTCKTVMNIWGVTYRVEWSRMIIIVLIILMVVPSR